MTAPVDADFTSYRVVLVWYAKTARLLDAFTCEITGVKEAQDIEYIHRMRVASRRLRAALPLFSSCFPDKQYTKWMKEITKITRALGDARDADVQIAFLQKSLKKIQKGQGLDKNDHLRESTFNGARHPVPAAVTAEETGYSPETSPFCTYGSGKKPGDR